MERSPIRTKCWLSIIAGTALVSWVLSAPIGTPQTPDLHIDLVVLSQDLPHASDRPELAFRTATQGAELIDADHFKFIEEDEEKSYRSFSHLDSPTSILPDWPAKALSYPISGNSPSRTVAVPLRC